MITIESKGSFKRTDAFLKYMSKKDIFKSLETYAKQGVEALSSATPVDSGLAASSWYYEVKKGRGSYSITWLNSDVEDGFPVAIMLQYGYGTGTGGYVRGVDYINPAIKPIFDKIAEQVWKEVTSA
jgi:hypothetical protein